jgi:hypothetical protein
MRVLGHKYLKMLMDKPPYLAPSLQQEPVDAVRLPANALCFAYLPELSCTLFLWGGMSIGCFILS